MLKYLRIHLFYRFLKPFSEARRRQRMAWFSQFLKDDPNPQPRILDLGGQPEIWDSVEKPLEITLLNLPGIMRTPPEGSHHRFTMVEGDACAAPQYGDQSFDIVFSNSVIEHVGDESKQRDFASEVQRIGKRYWVQTPSIHFPIEPHNGMPFWWYYPDSVKEHFLKKWKEKLPAWTEMVEGTRVLSKDWLHQLFPLARIRTERFLAIPKSYVVCST
jgi:hypothetical protein